MIKEAFRRTTIQTHRSKREEQRPREDDISLFIVYLTHLFAFVHPVKGRWKKGFAYEGRRITEMRKICFVK